MAYPCTYLRLNRKNSTTEASTSLSFKARLNFGLALYCTQPSGGGAPAPARDGTGSDSDLSAQGHRTPQQAGRSPWDVLCCSSESLK